MNKSEKILNSIDKDDITKINVMTLSMTLAEPSAYETMHSREKAISTFYNTNDLITGGFYKHTSLLIDISTYEKI